MTSNGEQPWKVLKHQIEPLCRAKRFEEALELELRLVSLFHMHSYMLDTVMDGVRPLSHQRRSQLKRSRTAADAYLLFLYDTSDDSYQLLSRAADMGHPVALWKKGEALTYGHGVERDHPLALHCFMLASERGCIGANGHIAAHFLRSHVPPDYRRAAHYYLLSERVLGSDYQLQTLLNEHSQLICPYGVWTPQALSHMLVLPDIHLQILTWLLVQKRLCPQMASRATLLVCAYICTRIDDGGKQQHQHQSTCVWRQPPTIFELLDGAPQSDDSDLLLDLVRGVVERNGFDIDAVTGGLAQWNGRSALYIACEKNLLRIVKYLVAQGADITLRNTQQYSVLHCVTSVQMAKFFLSHKEAAASILHSKSLASYTPLNRAVYRRNMELTRLLVDAGAPVQGSGALEMAIHRDDLHMARYLLSVGAKVDPRSSIIIGACDRLELDTVRLLAQHGIDLMHVHNLSNNPYEDDERHALQYMEDLLGDLRRASPSPKKKVAAAAQILHLMRSAGVNCRRATHTLLAIRAFRRSVLTRVAPDLVLRIAKLVWSSRCDYAWYE